MEILYHHRTQGRRAEGAHIRAMIKAFRDLGHNVNIASFPGVDVEATDDQVIGGTQHNVTVKSRLIGMVAKNIPEVLFEIFEILYNIYAIVNLSRNLILRKTDFIYERYSLFMIAGVICSKLFRIPLHLEINDSAIVERVRPLSMKWLARTLESWIFRQASHNYFISNHFKEHVTAAYGNIASSSIVPNAADMEVFDSARYIKTEEKAKLGLADKIVCGYVGGFLPWHGIGDLVRDAVDILKSNKKYALLLIGDGPEYTRIHQIIMAHQLDGQVVMPGRVNHALVPRYIAAMDFSVLPDSNDYGSPMKIFEYMAMGVPVIAPDYGPVKEVIGHDETGWLFPRGDNKSCYKLLTDTFNSGVLINKTGNAARRYIAEHRTWKVNAGIVLDAHNSVISTRIQ